MAKWSVWISAEAKDELIELDKAIRERITEKLDWLAANFDLVRPIPLTGDRRDYFKLRVGDWRVIYKIDYDSYLIRVYGIDRRDKVYKRRI